MAVAAQLPMADVKGEATPCFQSINRFAAEITHYFGIGGELGEWFEIRFLSPHAEQKPFGFKLNLFHCKLLLIRNAVTSLSLRSRRKHIAGAQAPGISREK